VGRTASTLDALVDEHADVVAADSGGITEGLPEDFAGREAGQHRRPPRRERDESCTISKPSSSPVS